MCKRRRSAIALAAGRPPATGRDKLCPYYNVQLAARCRQPYGDGPGGFALSTTRHFERSVACGDDYSVRERRGTIRAKYFRFPLDSVTVMC